MAGPTVDGGADNTSCGANSFMLRDSVCDEATNTKICLFDSGDCCLEIKDRTLCQNCSCILLIDREKLRQQFSDWEIKPLNNPDAIDGPIERWVVTVEEVVSSPVCTVLCLDHSKQDSINAWHYREDDQICRCGWIEASPCPKNLVHLDWDLDTKLQDLTHFTAFLQMTKTLPCGI